MENNAALTYPIEDFKIPVWQRMRTKLLLLIALLVFITEVLVYIPSIASQRSRWLENRFQKVEALSLIIFNADNNVLNNTLRNEVLNSIDASSITLIKNGEKKELLSDKRVDHIDESATAGQSNETMALLDSFRTLLSSKPRTIQITGLTKKDNATLEIVISNASLRKFLLNFTLYFLFVSLTISIVAATLIYSATQWLLVRPLQDIYLNMIGFVLEPDNPSRIMVPEDRNDELGATQRRISAIETELQQNYVRQKHLANLGLAVSKINHDMRNILASAQLMSDHLAEVKDPVVQKLAPKLISAIARATHYSQSVVTYGRVQESPPERQRLKLRRLVDDVYDSLLLEGSDQIELQNFVPADFEIDADPDQLHRVITNLVRNAMQALLYDKNDDCVIKRITIKAGRLGSTSIIDIEDTGPGLPEKAKEYLFSPFQSSTKRDGTGLGLAICKELIRAHGGTISPLEDGKPGAHFEIRIPDIPASLSEWRKQQKRA